MSSLSLPILKRLYLLLIAVHRLSAGHRAELYAACILLLVVSVLEGSVTVILVTVVTNILGSTELPPAILAITEFVGITNKPGLNMQSLVIVITGLLLREAMLGVARSYLYLITPAIVTAIRDRVLENLFSARFAYLDRFESGTFRQVLVNECSKTVAAAQSIVLFVGQLSSIIVIISIMVYMSPLLSAIIAGFALSVGPARILYARMLHRFEARSLDQTFALHNLLQEIVVNIRLIKLIGLAPKFAEETHNTSNKTMWLRAYTILIRTWDPMIVYLATLLMIGGVLLINERLAFSDPAPLIAFFLVFYRLVSPAVAVSAAVNEVIANEPHVRATLRFFDPRSKQMERADGRDLPLGPIDLLSLRNLTFSYGGAASALQDVSLEARRGEITAIVGPSGSGKSSIANLLLGMYDPDKGEIALSGPNGRYSLNELSLASLRRAIGIVTQDVTLLNTTIASIIRSGDLAISDKAVIDAAQKADAHDFIMSLPNGYDTAVGERGIMLSGGQRQRILIAQIMALRTRVLLLDEATSALDVGSERRVHETLQQRKNDCLIIVITHRLSSLKDFDRIHVMGEGRLIESGSWNELMAARGALYAMVAAGEGEPGMALA